MLVLSLTGTALSFFMAAYARSGWMLFAARALDGITAGNISVASAVIADTTIGKDRAKGFGIIGAAFGFGFVFGPAIAGLTIRFGMGTPFLVAGIVSVLAVVATMVFLDETNTHEKAAAKGKLFDFKRFVFSVFDKNVGIIFFLGMAFSFAHSMYTYAFQPFATHVFGMSVAQISYIFMGIGVVGLIAQAGFVGRAVKVFGESRALSIAFFLEGILFMLLFFAQSLWIFIGMVIVLSFISSFVGPISQTILSKETDAVSQGSVMGLFSSYTSIGTIFGPIAGGMITSISPRLPFLAIACMVFFCFILSVAKIRSHIKEKLHAFASR